MEQVPHVAVYCQENIQSFVDAVPKYILPMVVRYLNDANSQVQKKKHLFVLLEIKKKSQYVKKLIQTKILFFNLVFRHYLLY